MIESMFRVGLLIATCSLLMAWPFLALYYTFGSGSRWLKVADHYRSSWRSGPTLVCWVSFRVAPWQPTLFMHGDGLCHVTVQPDGLQVANFPLTTPWTPMFFVPWNDLELIGRRGHYEYEGGGVTLIFAKEASVRIRLSGQAVDRLMKIGAPWRVGNDGQLTRFREPAATAVPFGQSGATT